MPFIKTNEIPSLKLNLIESGDFDRTRAGWASAVMGTAEWAILQKTNLNNDMGCEQGIPGQKKPVIVGDLMVKEAKVGVERLKN